MLQARNTKGGGSVQLVSYVVEAANTLAYLTTATITAIKSLITLGPERSSFGRIMI
jgi:hypothetical protein